MVNEVLSSSGGGAGVVTGLLDIVGVVAGFVCRGVLWRWVLEKGGDDSGCER